MNDQVVDETKVQELIGYLKLTLLVVVIVGIGAGVYFFIQSRAEEKSVEAYSALFQAERLEENAAKEAEALKADITDLVLKWPEAKKQELEAAYLKVAHEHGGTVAAISASLRAARWNFLEKNYAESVRIYKESLNQKGLAGQALLQAMVLEGLGAAYEAQNQFKEAADTYADALKLKDNPLKPLAYFGKARAELGLGKKAEAAASLEKVIQEFPKTPYERKARVLKALAG